MNLSKDITNDFPIKDRIYLNNASVSITPNITIKKMTEFLQEYGKMGPDSLESKKLIEGIFQNTRKNLSELLQCQPDEIILTQSTTDGINIVANGLSINKKNNIIIRGGSHEHHANLYPWLKLASKIKIKELSIDENGFFKMNQFEQLLDNQTILVVLSHGLYNTGSIIPVETIGKLLKKRNIQFFVDAAQTIGCVGKVSVNDIGCNFMSFNGSKWLCGPMGTGIFFCRRDSSKYLEPLTIGGESAMIYDKNKIAFKEIPEKFQTGFRNYVGIVGLNSSLNYLKKFGFDNIRKKNLKLANIFRDELTKNPDIILYGPDNENLRTSIVSFSIKNKDPSYVVEKLEKQKIILAVREIFDKKIIRASPHFFNSEEQIFRVLRAIKKL